MRVLKYPLSLESMTSLLVPEGAQFVDIQVQRGVPTLWLLVDDGPCMEKVTIYCVGTGQKLPPEAEKPEVSCLGTVLLNDGDLVLHYFIEV